MKHTLYIFFLLLHICGCNLFETRTPENPTEQNTNFIQPISADIVLTNFKNSIEDYNVDNYIRCLSDENFTGRRFKFTPAAVTGIDRALFENWNLESERQYFTNLRKPQYGRASLVLSNRREIIVSSDSVVYNFDYYLFYPHSSQNYQVSGNLQFYLAPDAFSNWSIYRWDDFQTGQPTTWTNLKAIFSTGF